MLMLVDDFFYLWSIGDEQMKAVDVTAFRKTAACPSDTILVSYNSRKLSNEIMSLVKYHLADCDFCAAELPLLDHYSQPQKGEPKPPDIPMNLRVLAESLLYKSGKIQVTDEPARRNDRRASGRNGR
jgi:hypothetical protein